MPSQIVQLPRKLISTVGAGFGLALLLIIALTLVGLHQLAATNAHLETIVQENSVKTRLANQMRDILRDRAISMLTIVVSGDSFEKDQEMLRFYGFGSAYQQVRLELDKIIERPEEQEVLARIDRLTRANQPVMVRIVDLAVEGYTFLAFEELQREGIPLQRQLVRELDTLIQIQRDMTAKAAEGARSDYERTRWLLITLGLLAVLVAAGVAVTVMRRTARLAAVSERERTKFLTLFETNTDGIVILKRNGFTDCNPATLEMFRMDSVEDFLRRRPQELGEEQQPCGTPANLLAERHIREAVEKGHAFFRWTARRPDGSTFPAEIALHAMILDGEPVIQAIMRDVSAQKEAEAALEAARDAAVAAAEMKSQFVANVSHEIRTPLSALVSLAQAMWMESEKHHLPQEFTGFLESVRSGGNYLNLILTNLLDVSAAESGHLPVRADEFYLRDWTDDMRNILEPVASSHSVRLVWRFPDDEELRLRTDQTRLTQILLNLAHNAIKFGGAGTSVEISIACDGGGFAMSVDDQGPGVPPDRLGGLFGEFAQSQACAPAFDRGVGLGLAVVNQNATLLGGGVQAENLPARGMRFTFSLPASAGIFVCEP